MEKKMENEMETGFGGLQARYPSSTLFPPFSFWGLLIKAEYQEKGYPYYYGVTGEPSIQALCLGFRGLGLKGGVV